MSISVSLLRLFLAAGLFAGCVPSRSIPEAPPLSTNLNPMIANSFQPAVDAFIGDGQAGYYMPNSSVADQIVIGLGVPGTVVELGDGDILYDGCRPHSCSEKAAVIADNQDMIVGAALLHYACTTSGCSRSPHVAIFLNEASPPDARHHFEDWAESHATKPKYNITILPDD